MKSMVILTLPYLALWVMCGGCSNRSSEEKLPPLEVKVIEAQCDSLTQTMNFPCVTYGLYEVKLEPRVAGYLQSVGYEQGSRVKKNQLLFTIEPTQYMAEVAEAEASLLSAKAQLVNAENRYNRYKPLWQRNAISKSSLDEAVAELAEARAAVNSAKASLNNAKADLGYTKVYAPFDGIIGQTNGAVGEYVGLGTEYSIINTLSNVDSIYVYLSIPTAKYLELVAKDTLRERLYNDKRMVGRVVMQLSSGEIFPYEGCYKFTQRAVSSQTGSVVLHILFPNPEGLLRPGQYVRVMADFGAKEAVVLVPQRCIMQTQGQGGVFVVDKENVVSYRKVTLGDVCGDKWEVKDGLQQGEKVLTESLGKVHSGDKITPQLVSYTP
ncbi:MAG: efflux RND transporter periplasmic adaptor subunit [Rikenellaceae bacterium]